MWLKIKYPLEIWLGRGKPLNPYLCGILIAKLLSELKPKELKVIPDQYFTQPGMKDFLEWSILRSWVKAWTKMVHWYSSIALLPDATLEQLLDGPPVVSTSWNATLTER